jgi:hypothetical protein
MLNTTKTKKGWMVEITHTVYGMLEEGGVCGRKVLYLNETLERLDINPDWSPTGHELCGTRSDPGVSNEEWLVHSVIPDKVLRVGTPIK